MKEAAEWWNSLTWDEQCHYAWEHYKLKPEGLGIIEIMKIYGKEISVY